MNLDSMAAPKRAVVTPRDTTPQSERVVAAQFRTDKAQARHGVSTPATATRNISPAYQRIQRVSVEGVQFVLDKLAESIIPVRAHTHWQSRQSTHDARVCHATGRTRRRWYLSGPTLDYDFPDVGPAWLIYHPSLHGGESNLEILDSRQQSSVTLQARTAGCPHWTALLSWVVLRERGPGQLPHQR